MMVSKFVVVLTGELTGCKEVVVSFPFVVGVVLPMMIEGTSGSCWLLVVVAVVCVVRSMRAEDKASS